MITKKKKFGYKLKNINYNNKLEQVLSKKMFKEDVKNLLLDSLYKIETSYSDYSTVKKNVLDKEKYIQNIINIIENDCDDISFMTPPKINDEKNIEAHLVDKEKKQICCYPIARKLLYCIAKIKKSDDIIKSKCDFLNRTLTNTLNIGNNINAVEPLRDFNGFSWNISILEIEDLSYNLIYQDLIILIGNIFLEQWINRNECMIDYIELFKSELEKRYNKKIANKIIELIEKLSILLEFKKDINFKKELSEKKDDVEKQLEKMNNKEKYLEDLCKEKKDLERKIKNIDLILNNKRLLHDKYIRLNQDLPLEKKIFSTRWLAKKMNEERNQLVKDLYKCNKLMNPLNFRKSKNQMENEYKFLILSDIQNLDKEIFKNLILLQIEVLKSFDLKISKAKEKQEMLKIMYELRYYYFLPITQNNSIRTTKELTKLINKLNENFLIKSEELKMLANIGKTKEQNIEILKYLFDLQIIKLENIYLKIIEIEDKLYVQFYDEDIADEKFQLENIQKSDLKIKINKLTKVFI